MIFSHSVLAFLFINHIKLVLFGHRYYCGIGKFIQPAVQDGFKNLKRSFNNLRQMLCFISFQSFQIKCLPLVGGFDVIGYPDDLVRFMRVFFVQ